MLSKYKNRRKQLLDICNPHTTCDILDIVNSYLPDSYPQGSRELFKTELLNKEDCFVLKAEMPGIAKEDLNITFEQDILTLTCTRNAVSEGNNEQIVWQERSYGQSTRAFSIKNGDPEQISAELEDGVLTVTIGKRNKPATNIQIEVK